MSGRLITGELEGTVTLVELLLNSSPHLDEFVALWVLDEEGGASKDSPKLIGCRSSFLIVFT